MPPLWWKDLDLDMLMTVKISQALGPQKLIK